MAMNRRLYKILLSGLCLAGIFAACRSCGKQKKKPYSPIEGDTIDVVITDCKRQTVREAMEESFGEGTLQSEERRELKQLIEKKYRLMGDSMERKLLKGEPIH